MFSEGMTSRKYVTLNSVNYQKEGTKPVINTRRRSNTKKIFLKRRPMTSIGKFFI